MPKHPSVPPRRPINYPRRGRTGFWRWIPSWRLVTGTILFLISALVGTFFILLANVTIPQPNDFATRQATIFTYADGSTQIAHIGMNRVSVPLSQIPQVVRQAVLAAEDRSFYSESGVSPSGILRAIRNDVTSGGGSLQGGSTITQQYVKNFYLTQQQTLSRKLDELLISIKTDEEIPKDTILQNYLNTIYFARNAYGIDTAARAYFGVPVSALANDPARAAYLAALVQSPSYYGTADTDPAAAGALQHRWNYVLDGMVTQGWLPAKQRASVTFPATVPYRSNDQAGTNGYLVNAASQYLTRIHQQNPEVPDADMLAQGGYTVVTTFRPDIVTAAQQAVDRTRASRDPAHYPGDADLHFGAAVVDTTNGAVLGFYGGPNYVTQGFNDATQAAGPFGTDVGMALANITSVRQKGDWTLRIPAFTGLGVSDANPADNPPSDDDLSATPLHVAGLTMLSANHGQYHDLYEVAKVLQGDRVVWQATPDTKTVPGYAGRTSMARIGAEIAGMDGSAQWAWSAGWSMDYPDKAQSVAVAVDLYATKPGGKGNRPLTGMSNLPPVPHQAALLTEQICGELIAVGSGIPLSEFGPIHAPPMAVSRN